MNVLATKHEASKQIESKGKPLGRVGVAIVLSFVGLVFATAFLGVQAATANTAIAISAAEGQLTAEHEELNEGERVSWSWFSVETQYDITSNNTEALAQECERADEAVDGSDGNFNFLATGLGSFANLSSDSAGNLYCFAAHVTDEAGNEQASDYGGYVVSSIETTQ